MLKTDELLGEKNYCLSLIEGFKFICSRTCLKYLNVNVKKSTKIIHLIFKCGF